MKTLALSLVFAAVRSGLAKVETSRRNDGWDSSSEAPRAATS
jgi:hypothetical protein